jgi:hypothetical protein
MVYGDPAGLWPSVGTIVGQARAAAPIIATVATIAMFTPLAPIAGPIALVAGGITAMDAAYTTYNECDSLKGSCGAAIARSAALSAAGSFAVGKGLNLGLKAANAARRAAKNACTVNSFDDDTPVLMADGTLKPIAEVEFGDMVWATDPETGEEGPRAVIDLIRHAGLHTMVQIKLADGSTIDATDGHPFWVEARGLPDEPGANGGWAEAIDVRIGDELLNTDGETIEVSSIAVSVADLTAYNLTVAGLHTYYAGDEPVLVHNSNVGDCGHSLGNFKKLTDPVAKKKGAHKFKEDKFDDAPGDSRSDIYKCSKCGYEQVIRKRGR